MRIVAHHSKWMVMFAAAVLSACGSGSGSATPTSSSPPKTSPSTTGAPVTTQAPAEARRSISVTALGRVTGIPDSVTITLGVETFAPTTAEVLATLSTKSSALNVYLTGAGIAAADLQTTNLSANPTYGNYSPEGTPSITGYQGAVTVSVRVKDLTAASTMIDGAAAIVGDALRVQGLSWAFSDSEARLAQARADGVERAKTEAKQLADASGLRLGEIVSVTTPADPYAYTYSGATGAGIPFNPGSQELQVAVTVVFDAVAA